MSALVSKLEALLTTEPMCPVSAEMIRTAIAIENGDYKCSQCGLNCTSGADEEGDGGWWCSDCMKAWESMNGCHWEDGTPLVTAHPPMDQLISQLGTNQ